LKTPPTIYDSQGRPLVLGHSLGRGGEGEVHELSMDKALVAKLYHKPLSQEHVEKLRAMVGLKTEALLRVAAWPVDTCHRRPGGEIVGLVMPKISAHQEIHHLYSPKSRLNAFPDATWRFLLHAAANLSRAFAVVHEHGHLVGDVNHGNALVSRQATVRLIDCDSFQIQAGGRQFLCGVGVSTHVPPELQGGSLRVVRTVDHDAFGLAVLIFQILFMGRHPYSGHFLGSGEMPIERAIRENRFAYGPAAGLRQMRQPPNTLDLAAASRPVADLFQRAFSPPGAARPRAHEWVAALDAVKTSTCGRNPAHLYLEGLPSCPWCDLESRAGTIFFYLTAVHHVPGTGFDVFDVMAVWARISAVAGPGAPPAIPDPTAYDLPPSATALAMSRKRIRQIAAAGVIVIGLAFGIYDGSAVSSFLGSVVLSLVILYAADPARKEAKQRLKDAQATFRKLQEIWPQQSEDAPFRRKRGELEGLKEEYRGLPAFRQKKLAALEAGRRATQLERFLDRHRIDKAKIPSIGPGRTATLQSYGIETAWDLEQQEILDVPGFGPVLAQTLLSWRRSIESKFVFDSTKGVDPADVAALDRTIAARKAQIERVLQTGGAELEKIRHQITLRRQSLLQQLEIAAKAVAQEEADLRVL
jgi:DNA-binding helix-hairpin-helix protein with protein kinase domain